MSVNINGGMPDVDHRDPERNGEAKVNMRRSWFKALVQDFSHIWFTWCMNSGIIAILMHQYNYQFHGLPVLSTIAFLVGLILFIIFSLLFVLRLAWFRKQAFQELADNAQELALIACWPMAWLTLVSFVSLTVSQAHWGGHDFTIVAYVMWWIGAAWIVTTLCTVFFTLITVHDVTEQDLPFAIFVPAVGVATMATVGGLVTSFSASISARLAVPVIIFSFCGVGIGLFMAVFLYTSLLHRLLLKGWPAQSQTATLFMFVGPAGQSAAALLLLGSAADTYNQFGGYDKGAFLTKIAAAPLDVTCVLFSLLLLGVGTLWLIMAFFAMFYRAYRKELSWGPEWNAIIFPVGTLTTTTLILGIKMHSPFFKVITGILLVFLVLVFFKNLAFTVWNVSRGKLLVVRDDPRIKQQLEEKHKAV